MGISPETGGEVKESTSVVVTGKEARAYGHPTLDRIQEAFTEYQRDHEQLRPILLYLGRDTHQRMLEELRVNYRLKESDMLFDGHPQVYGIPYLVADVPEYLGVK